MFSNPIRIYGNYSRIAKKYSKDNSNEKAEPFVLIDVEGKKSIERKTYIFDTLLECFMTAMMLGIIADKKEPEDSDKTIYATVFADILGKKRSTLERIYQHMVLTKYIDLEIDERIKKAFPPSAIFRRSLRLSSELNTPKPSQANTLASKCESIVILSYLPSTMMGRVIFFFSPFILPFPPSTYAGRARRADKTRTSASAPCRSPCQRERSCGKNHCPQRRP